ncbi:MAG: hypothetical protein BWZ00_01251 [Bacteroidetes bacterium ADurb.BinA174]|jgi:hypothetical protein|nr:MAG: hypothetical protein BWZ00_01251 [Bacteroidetes bacterium ADurb.BinA174]
MGRKTNKSALIFLIFIVIIAIAFFTNPDKEAHKEAIIEKTDQIMEEIIAERNDAISSTAWELAGKKLLSEFIDTNVTVDNYYLFSIPKVNWDGNSYPIGVGAFGKVYITKHLNRDVVQPILNDMEDKVKDLLPDFFKGNFDINLYNTQKNN